MNNDNSVTQNHDGTYVFHSPHLFQFEQGGSLPSLTLAYETHGKINAARDNIILIHHALSTHSHVASHAKNQAPGWWEKMVGPAKPIDTDRYFVICINNLGSCFGSSGPASDSTPFPYLTLSDIARSQRLLLSELGIQKIYAMISPSMGAMISLQFAVLFPDFAAKIILISSSARSYPQNIALRSIQREIIRLDPAWQQGAYAKGTVLPGFIAARKLAHLTYRNPNELNERFRHVAKNDVNTRTIHSYLEYNAKKFTANFDANCYLALTQAMDDFDVTQSLHAIKSEVLVISVSSDILFTPEQQRELYQLLDVAGVPSLFVYYESDYGHDAFLVEAEGMGYYLREFIAATNPTG